MEKSELIAHLEKIVTVNLETPADLLTSERFLIIYDRQTPLSQLLAEAYRELLPGARARDYDTISQQEVLEEVESCQEGDLVILIESTSFRMSNFRWRLELFNRGLKVIEHAHLVNNWPEETDNYLDTLRYDGPYFQQTSEWLKRRLDRAAQVRVISTDGSELIYTGPFEEIKKNIGDFSAMKNKGCGFPIGEIFTEPVDITGVNGEIAIFAFADAMHRVVFPDENFHLRLEGGQVKLLEDPAKLAATEWGQKLLEIWAILSDENDDGVVWARELGLGLNRGISKTKRLHDISAYERICGVHISLGLKHDIYRGKIPKNKSQRYHVDIFPDVREVWIDEERVWADGDYSPNSMY